VVQIKAGTTHLNAIKASLELFKGLTYDLSKDQNVLLYITDASHRGLDKVKIQEVLVKMDSEVPVPVTRYAVGIDEADIDDLKQVASTPDKAYYGANFDVLPNFLSHLTAINSIGC